MPRFWLILPLIVLGGCATQPPSTPVAAKAEAPAPTDLPPAGIARIKALEPRERAERAWAAAVYWVGQKEFHFAEDYLAYAQTLPPEVAGSDLAGRILFLRGVIAYAGADIEGALKLYRQAAAQFTTVKNEAWLLTALSEQEGVEQGHGYLADALETVARIITLAEGRQDRLLSARFEYERGMLLYKLRRFGEADVAARRATELFTALGLKSGLAGCDKLLGNLCSARGDWPEALRHFAQGYEVFKATGNFLESANCRLNAAQVYIAQTRFEPATVELDEAILLFTRAGSLGGVGLCHHSKGLIALERGDFLHAEQSLRLAEKLFAEKNDVFRLAQTKVTLSKLYKKRGDVSTAVDYQLEAERLFEQVNNRR